MIETYFIGDTHFGHKNIIEFNETKAYRRFDSIQEHDEELIKRWNSVVRPKDNVFHLGDFCFGAHNLAIAGRLNGNKRLILGNHDVYSAQEYLKYFSKVFGMIEHKSLILSHAPLHPSQLERWKANIHGHLHTKVLDDKRYINVSAERVGLTPVPFSYILSKIEEAI